MKIVIWRWEQNQNLKNVKTPSHPHKKSPAWHSWRFTISTIKQQKTWSAPLVIQYLSCLEKVLSQQFLNPTIFAPKKFWSQNCYFSFFLSKILFLILNLNSFKPNYFLSPHVKIIKEMRGGANGPQEKINYTG